MTHIAPPAGLARCHDPYLKGCQGCRDYWRWYNKHAERRRAQHGPAVVDGTDLIAAIRYAQQAGWSITQIAKASHLPTETLRRTVTQENRPTRHTHDRAIAGLVRLERDRRRALDDLASSLDRAQGRTDGVTVRWPKQPLRDAAACKAHPGEHHEGCPTCRSLTSLLTKNERRSWYRGDTVSDADAERLCLLLGLDPAQVWGPAWHASEGAA